LLTSDPNLASVVRTMRRADVSEEYLALIAAFLLEVTGVEEQLGFLAVVDGVEVVHAPGEGDDTIAAIAEANREVIVVTADRALAERARAANAEVVGPSWLLDQLAE
jgi:uncharacterized protein YaiI (UPF0178 family)